MVALTEAIASNQRISSTFPKGLVAVFVGGTSGIGEYTIKAFAKYTHNSRAYIIGRSEPNAKRIMAECRTLGPSSTFEFIQGDISLLKTVDDICKKIRAKETAINILFETQGSMAFSDSKFPYNLHTTVFMLFIYPGRFQSLRKVSHSLLRLVCTRALDLFSTCCPFSRTPLL